MQPTLKSGIVTASVLSFAPGERLWRAWAEPELLQQWFCDHAWGEARLGGDMFWRFPDYGVQAHLKVTELIDGTRMRLESEDGAVAFLLEPEGHGTRVTVTQRWAEGHEPPAEAASGVRSGWLMSMALLRHYAENYFEQPRQTLLLRRPWSGALDAVAPFYEDPRQMKRWLKVTDRPREILIDTGQEVCYRWDAAGGVLECKAYHWAGGAELALRVTSWSKEYDLGCMKPQLEESLDHLLHLLIS